MGGKASFPPPFEVFRKLFDQQRGVVLHHLVVESGVALGDPEPTVESLQATNQRILAAGEQQERLIEALLTLARSERGADWDEPFDLAVLTQDVLASRGPEAERRGLRVESTLQPATIIGDPGLVERLVANLVDNAMEHNVADGSIWVSTRSREGRTELSIANTGPVIPPGDVARLSEPFQRATPDRTGHGEGSGLGLSIVRAIADAHDAVLDARARPEGGLEVEVAFPVSGVRAGDPVGPTVPPARSDG